MRFKLTTFSILLLLASVKAQTSIQLSASEIKLKLEKLGNTASVLYIAAHPDDENTRLLSYLSTERKVRTGYLSLTRGDGGQNLIGSEQAEQLGLIRTQELLAARRIDGAEQFFTRANDFGFSKTSAETFKIWNKEKILGDVVWVIRKFRPDVIITRFPGDARAGHGHHAASSLLAQEAFLAAANPKRFPEQLKQVSIWQAKRIFWNTFNFGGTNTTDESQLKVDVGAYNALLGKSYGEIASESRSQHKSQGFGVPRQRGESIEYFSLLNGSAASTDLLEGVEQGWLNVPNGLEIEKLINELNTLFQTNAPQRSLPNLIKLYTLLSRLENPGLRERKLAELSDLILAAGGLWIEAYSTQATVALGENVPVRIQALSRYGLPAQLRLYTNANPAPGTLLLKPNQLQSMETSVPAQQLSQPYWLAEKHDIGEYQINDQHAVGYPENPDRIHLKFTITIDGFSFDIERPVVYKFTDPIRGELYRNLEVTPPVVSEILSSSLLFPDDSPKALSIKITAFQNNAKGELRPALPKGWNAEPASVPFQFINKGDEATFRFQITCQKNAVSGKLRADVVVNGERFSKACRVIEYDHIPAITWFPESEANLIKLDLKTAGKNIAYIPGAGDLIPEALKQIGYTVTIVPAAQLESTDLEGFDAIITGVRLYNTKPEMKRANDKLLKYVENGGLMLVQYNVNQPLVTNAIGPYPFSLTRNRVTEEDAAITLLNPNHPVFHFPNKITADDFKNWIQERGVYFVKDENSRYQALLSMQDTGEEAQTGSLIVADYGKGRFVYTGLAFFRQLPAGVPGAYRLFVNLISKQNGK